MRRIVIDSRVLGASSLSKLNDEIHALTTGDRYWEPVGGVAVKARESND